VRAPTIKPSIGIGLYAGISIIGFSYLTEKKVTPPFIGGLLLALLTSIALHINISLSEKFENEQHSYCSLFWTTTFVIALAMGTTTCWVLKILSWHNCFGVALIAGICGFSHLSSHDFSATKRKLLNTEIRHREAYIEWLKLEHSSAQTTFQLISAMVGLILTGGVVAYYTSVGSFWNPEMIYTFIAIAWVIVGLWFGIWGLLLDKMNLVRDELNRLAQVEPNHDTNENDKNQTGHNRSLVAPKS